MKQSILLTLLAFLHLLASAQGYSYKTDDTLLISEVKISAFKPVDNAQMLNFYKSSQFSSIDDISARMAGVALLRRGAYAMEPVLNGMGGGRINITIDGMKMFGACTDNMDPITSYIEPLNLSALNVMHGTRGNSMGNTVGGALDLKLETPEPGIGKTHSVVLGGGYNSISSGVDGNLAFALNQRKWAFILSSSYRKHNNYSDGLGNEVQFSQFEKFNLHTGFAYKLGSTQMLKTNVIIDNGINVGYPALPMDVSLAKGRIYSLDYLLNPIQSPILRFKAKIYANTVYHVMDDSQRDSIFVLNNASRDTVGMRMDMPGWSDTYGAYAEMEIASSTKSRLYLKVDNYLNKLRAEMTMYMNNPKMPGEPPMFVETWPEMERYTAGIYASYKYFFNAALSFNADARMDISNTKIVSDFGRQQFSIFGYDVSEADQRVTKGANTSLVWKPAKIIRTEFGLGYGERIPTISELYGFYLFNAHDGYDYIGNPDIKNESVFNGWLKSDYASKNVKLSFEARYSRLYDYISGVTEPEIGTLNLYASGTRVYKNISNATIMGASLYAQWQASKRLVLISSASYTYGAYADGSPIQLMPPLQNFLALSYALKRYNVQLENESALAQNRINTAFGETKSSAYSVFNLRINGNYSLNEMPITLAFGVNNVLNSAYKNHLDWGMINRPGRSFYANFRIHF